MGLSNDLSREAGSLSCCRPNPHRRFQSEFEALFPLRWSPGLSGLLRSPPFVRFICVQVWGRGVLPTALPSPFSATLSPALSVYLRECGAAGSASGQTACPVCPTLRQPVSVLPRQHESSPLHLPVSTHPTGLDECLFFISLVSDFLAVRFSVSSGCARRHSVSTYAAILVLLRTKIILKISRNIRYQKCNVKRNRWKQ